MNVSSALVCKLGGGFSPLCSQGVWLFVTLQKHIRTCDLWSVNIVPTSVGCCSLVADAAVKDASHIHQLSNLCFWSDELVIKLMRDSALFDVILGIHRIQMPVTPH